MYSNDKLLDNNAQALHEAAVLGLSIRNSYFTEENISALLFWAASHFRQIFVLIPDEPAIDTLRALGYSLQDATSKSRLACNNLANKCRRMTAALNIDPSPVIIRWSDISTHKNYVESYELILQLYRSRKDSFYEDIRTMTRHVVGDETKLNIGKAIDIGSYFLLKELAFILRASEILNVPKATYIYHKAIPVLEQCFAHQYSVIPSPKNRFEIFTDQHYGSILTGIGYR